MLTVYADCLIHGEDFAFELDEFTQMIVCTGDALDHCKTYEFVSTETVLNMLAQEA